MTRSSSHQPRRPTLSAPHFLRLSSILKQANEHYHFVAASTRAATHPTHHARTRAEKLGLAINIERAVNCPGNQVSVVPLPIIETSPASSPILPVPQLSKPVRGRPALRLVVPQMTRPQADVPVSTGHTPAAAAPTVLRGKNIPWRGPTSRFSVTPNEPIFAFSVPPQEAQPAQIFNVRPRPAPKPEEPPVVPELLFEFDADDEWMDLELGYPPSGAADYAPSSSSESSSPSMTASNSSGPTTPDDGDVVMPPILINFAKRKNNVLDFEPAVITIDKRPKYERKSWVRGPHQI
ncbi:hypothetical protein R3P38DRAFT_1628231 [Favolaschia claudopus]|uniref:Uncharacterized protein n=1 Tax=Favolaschia claudopus TaxID=2862362 RepID=A0AAW0AFP8_9AGAR